MASGQHFQRRHGVRAVTRFESRRRPRAAFGVVVAAVAVLAAAVAETPAQAQDGPEPGPPERAFSPVVEGVVEGDLVLAGNSNVAAPAPGPPAAATMVDVDRDRSVLCAIRLIVPTGCSDNSSSAVLDVPAGARVVEARLYIDTTLARGSRGVRARLDGPGRGFDYRALDASTGALPKLWEATGAAGAGGLMRQAVWDVTDYVAANGAGNYTVADIVVDDGPAPMPYATWAIMVLYERDPALVTDLAALAPEEQDRFTRRAVSWHDGFFIHRDGRHDVTLGGFEVPLAGTVFAKSFHVVAHGDAGELDNLVFDGDPLGNSAAADNGGPPPGVVVGVDHVCNDTTDVFNGSICALGQPVGSGAGVDVDVARIPDTYVTPGATEATLSILSVDDGLLAPGLLAVSIDLGPEVEETPPTTEPP